MAEHVLVADCETGLVEPVDLTAEQEAELAAFRASAQAVQAERDAADENEAQIRQKLEAARTRLETDVAAMTATPPTLFASLTANERRYLATLGRVELGLIRLQLRRLDAAE